MKKMRTKRLFDIALSAALLLLIWPLLLLLCLAIRLDSPGSAVFSQWRVGRGHRLFRLYKLRTMTHDSEDLDEYLRDDEIFIQRQNDPRLTRLGGFLRRTSLDELPQLYNILRGDMSFVGPRPLVLYEQNRLPPSTLHRLDVRPGLTGFAQAAGRSGAELLDRCARDLYYVRNISFWLDARILWRTFSVVFHKENAY